MGDDLSGTSGPYQEALQYLFARTTGKSKFGLERTRALLAALGNPQDRIPCFHVAGTNGKGSVCATLEALLRARGSGRPARVTDWLAVGGAAVFLLGALLLPWVLIVWLLSQFAEALR